MLAIDDKVLSMLGPHSLKGSFYKPHIVNLMRSCLGLSIKEWVQSMEKIDEWIQNPTFLKSSEIKKPSEKASQNLGSGYVEGSLGMSCSYCERFHKLTMFSGK